MVSCVLFSAETHTQIKPVCPTRLPKQAPALSTQTTTSAWMARTVRLRSLPSRPPSPRRRGCPCIRRSPSSLLWRFCQVGALGSYPFNLCHLPLRIHIEPLYHTFPLDVSPHQNLPSVFVVLPDCECWPGKYVQALTCPPVYRITLSFITLPPIIPCPLLLSVSGL